MKIFLIALLLSIAILSGCATLTPSERVAWDNYFIQMENAQHMNIKFLLENPK